MGPIFKQIYYTFAWKVDLLERTRKIYWVVEDYNISNFQAIILGSDQGRTVYTKKLNNLVQRYSLNKKVKFISHCKEMPLAYSLSDVVISASIEPEAFGRVSVEAQSMGKPIIASNIGGSKETIINKKTGFLYKYDDPRAVSYTHLRAHET